MNRDKCNFDAPWEWVVEATAEGGGRVVTQNGRCTSGPLTSVGMGFGWLAGLLACLLHCAIYVLAQLLS